MYKSKTASYNFPTAHPFSVVRIPRISSAWMVRPGLYASNSHACIVPNRGQTIWVADGTILYTLASVLPNHANNVVFDITNTADVTLTSNGTGTIWMHKAEVYGSVQNQYRHAIQVKNSSRIAISKL